MEDLEAKTAKSPALPRLHQRRRPATTEGAGARPRYALPTRPKTAHERPTIDAPARLEILNTLMDEEWRCCGSKLTSHGAVCGNLAQALRRPVTARRTRDKSAHEALIESGLDIVSREMAGEIPLAPGLADWERFKKEVGIDIDIDFSKRLPNSGDATHAIERLERIERETAERLDNPGAFRVNFDFENPPVFGPIDYEIWKTDTFPMLLADGISSVDTVYRPIEDMFSNIDLSSTVSTPEESLPD